jgi:GNAT superfamily N-acetyltransferase
MNVEETILRDLSAPRLIDAIEGNTIALARAFGGMAGAELDDGPEMLRFFTGVGYPFFNGVARTRLAQDTSEGIAAEIKRTLDYFEPRGAPIYWWAGPATRPTELDHHLLAAGLQVNLRDCPGMAIDLSVLPAEAASLAGLEIEPVRDQATLETWCHTFIASYGMPDPVGEAWATALSRFGLEPDSPMRVYLAWFEGRPVATSMMFLGAGVAGLYAVGTVEAARGRGIGMAITAQPLLDARAAGYRAAILHSSPMGVRVYERMGFREYCKIRRYVTWFR